MNRAVRRCREGTISSGGDAPRQFDVCTGERREPRRRRQSMGGGDERQELHLSSLALGNAWFFSSDVASVLAAKSKLAAMLCARRERPASTNFGSGAMRWSKADCCCASRACNRFLVRAQLAERRPGEADASAKRSGSDEVVQSTFASHGLARAYRRMAATTLAAGKTLGNQAKRHRRARASLAGAIATRCISIDT